MSFSNQKDLFQFLREKLLEESALYSNRIDHQRVESLTIRWGEEGNMMEKRRIDVLDSIVNDDIKNLRILDMASGCGSYVFQCLKLGIAAFGVEPEKWKLELIEGKFEVYNFNPEWKNNIKEGVGEDIPFESESFDVVDSWQTFEHVQDVDACLSEIFRVLVAGGISVIRAPSYMTFYEGHYQLPWLPMMHGRLARAYLKLKGRPLDGLKTFSPIQLTQLRSQATKAGFKVFNLNKLIYKRHLRSKLGAYSNNSIVKTLLPLVYYTKNFLTNIKNLFRTERFIHLLLVRPPFDKRRFNRLF